MDGDVGSRIVVLFLFPLSAPLRWGMAAMCGAAQNSSQIASAFRHARALSGNGNAPESREITGPD